MLNSLILSIGQLGDRPIIAVLVKTLALSLMIFALLALSGAYLLIGSHPCSLWGASAFGMFEGGVFALILMAIGIWLLFPAVAIGVIALFTDQIVDAVERRHYPSALEQSRRTGMGEMAAMGLKSSGRLLLYNLLALPFYIGLIITGVGTVILFVIVNGLALGADIFELVTSRHLNRGERRAWLKRHRLPRFFTGVLFAAMLLVPLLNLIAPVLAAAMATHIFHRLNGRVGTDIISPAS